MARAHFLGQDVLARRHEAQALAFPHGAVNNADKCHDAAVRVEVAVEDERAQRGVRVAFWRGDVVDHGFEQVVHADARLSRSEHRVVCGDRKRVLDFRTNALGVGRGQVDLVDKRDDLEVRVHRHHGVRDRLRLNALGCVDHEHRALACSQRAAHLVGEVDVPRGVDEVELVFLAVVGLVAHAYGLAFDRDAALALDVHRVEELGLHIALGDGARHLEDAVGKRRFPVVDMGDDGEVPDMRGVGHDDRWVLISCSICVQCIRLCLKMAQFTKNYVQLAQAFAILSHCVSSKRSRGDIHRRIRRHGCNKESACAGWPIGLRDREILTVSYARRASLRFLRLARQSCLPTLLSATCRAVCADYQLF